MPCLTSGDERGLTFLPPNTHTHTLPHTQLFRRHGSVTPASCLFFAGGRRKVLPEVASNPTQFVSLGKPRTIHSSSVPARHLSLSVVPVPECSRDWSSLLQRKIRAHTHTRTHSRAHVHSAAAADDQQGGKFSRRNRGRGGCCRRFLWCIQPEVSARLRITPGGEHFAGVAHAIGQKKSAKSAKANENVFRKITTTRLVGC